MVAIFGHHFPNPNLWSIAHSVSGIYDRLYNRTTQSRRPPRQHLQPPKPAAIHHPQHLPRPLVASRKWEEWESQIEACISGWRTTLKRALVASPLLLLFIVAVLVMNPITAVPGALGLRESGEISWASEHRVDVRRDFYGIGWLDDT